MNLKSLSFGDSAKWVELAIERYRTLTHILGTILVAWFLSSAVSELLALFIPSPQNNRSTQASSQEIPALGTELMTALDISTYDPICNRNIFDSQKRTPCTEVVQETEETRIDPNAPPVKSDLRATLFGTMVSTQLAAASIATIQAANDKEPRTHRVGDKINGEAEIYEIIRNKVFFYRGGRKEFLEVENLPLFQAANTPAVSPSPTAAANLGIVDKGGKKEIPRKKVEELMGNMTDLLQQARMVPDYQNGVVQGFKIFAIRPGSIFEQLGLKNGDTISQINGTKIDSLEKALPMLELLKTESNIAIDVSRGGAKQSINVNIN